VIVVKLCGRMYRTKCGPAEFDMRVTWHQDSDEPEQEGLEPPLVRSSKMQSLEHGISDIISGQRRLQQVLEDLRQDVSQLLESKPPATAVSPTITPSREATAQTEFVRSSTTGAEGGVDCGPMTVHSSSSWSTPPEDAAPIARTKTTTSSLNARFQKSKSAEMHLAKRDFFGDISHSQTSVGRSKTISYEEPQQQRGKIGPISPNNKFRIGWDCVSVVFLSIEAVRIPYSIAWERGDNDFLDLFFVIFWSFDLVLHFLTGSYKKGVLLMDFRKIARHYARTTLVLDLAVLIPDWSSVIIKMSGQKSKGPAQLLEVLRFFKINRFIRIATAIRNGNGVQIYDQIFAVMLRYGWAEHINLAAGVCKLMLMILLVNHLGCCLWKKLGGDATFRWTSVILGKHMTPRTQKSDYFSYMLHFYWSITSMVSGASTFEPTTTFELTFAVFWIFFGLIVGSSLISSLSAMLVQVQVANKDLYERRKMLRRYLYENRVPLCLSVPIESEVMAKMTARGRLGANAVESLAYLSPASKCEMIYEIYVRQGLAKHPFFRACNSINTTFLKDLTCHSLAVQLHDPAHKVFEPGQCACGMYFVHWGILEYTHEVQGAAFDKLTNGNFFCEIALWLMWNHSGWLETESQTELVVLKADAFSKILRGHAAVRSLAAYYSSAFCDSLDSESVASGSMADHTDLLHDDHARIVPLMPLKGRVLMSKPALDILGSSWAIALRPSKGLSELNQEVNAGKCDLVVSADSRVLRAVSLVTLHLARPDESILAQLGTWRKGEFHVGFEIPGTKVRAGELCSDALQRLISTKMGPLAEQVSVTDREVLVEEKTSRAYKILTRYIKTCYHASMTMDESQRLPVADVPRRHSHRSVLKSPQLSNSEFMAVSNSEDKAGSLLIYCWIDKPFFDSLSNQHDRDSVVEHAMQTIDFHRINCSI